MKYPDPESSVLELKREVPKNDQIVKTIIGFCNQNGGRLVVGVDDDGTIAGIPPKTAEQLRDSIEQTIYQASTPAIIPRIYSQTIEDKMILIIEVAAGMQPPYHRQSEGIERGTYIRLGCSTLRADDRIIRELSWRACGLSYDRTPLYQCTMQELDTEKIENFLSNRKSHGSAEATPDILSKYHFSAELHGHIYPSVTGILLFGKRPQYFLSEAMIICSHFKGVSGRDTIATIDCEGTLFDQYEQAVDFVFDRLYQGFTIRGLYRTDHLEIPEEAIREAILNAIIHRNYHTPAPAKIAIYNDRVEIYSPGTFPGPMSPADLRKGLSFLRNYALCRVFREIGAIEKIGSGLLTIFNSFAEARLQEPTIIEGPGFVKVILPRMPMLNDPSAGGANEFRKLTQMSDEFAIGDVVRILGISRSTAQRRLNLWLDAGLIQRTGSSRSIRYKITGVEKPS